MPTRGIDADCGLVRVGLHALTFEQGMASRVSACVNLSLARNFRVYLEKQQPI
jgi:hypothetical protein